MVDRRQESENRVRMEGCFSNSGKVAAQNIVIWHFSSFDCQICCSISSFICDFLSLTIRLSKWACVPGLCARPQEENMAVPRQSFRTQRGHSHWFSFSLQGDLVLVLLSKGAFVWSHPAVKGSPELPTWTASIALQELPMYSTRVTQEIKMLLWS